MNQMLSRRTFLGGTLATLPLAAIAANAAETNAPAAKPQLFERTIKIGIIGGGSRGSWISELFKKHGGYTIHAMADYFEGVADKSGEAMGVDPTAGALLLAGPGGAIRAIGSGEVVRCRVVDLPVRRDPATGPAARNG